MTRERSPLTGWLFSFVVGSRQGANVMPAAKKTTTKKTAAKSKPKRPIADPNKVLAGPELGTKPSKGRLEHQKDDKNRAKWLVLSQVRYKSTDTNEAVNASQFLIDEYGVPILDEDEEMVSNVISDISFSVADDLFKRGVLKPLLA